MRKHEAIKKVLVMWLGIIGVILQTAVYAYVWFKDYYFIVNRYSGLKFYFNGHILMILIYFVLLFFFTSTYGGLKVGYLKPLDIFLSQLFSLLIVNIISYFQISLMSNWLVNAGHMVFAMVIQLIVSGIWTILCDRIYRKVFPPIKMLLVYGERSIDDILSKFSSRKDKYQIEKCMNISEGIEAIREEAVNHYKAVILWDIHTSERNLLLKYFYSRSIRVYTMPKISDVLIKGSEQMHIFDTPILLIREYALSAEQRIAKRMLDIFCSVLLLIIASPFMLVTAIIIKCYDGGPVLYRQIRCTQGQRQFSILKFRSMRVDAEKDGVARLAAQKDDRITPIGKIIRACRIDELPQLFNILKGDMSFIGPRPERPEIIAQYVEEMPEFVFRTKVKAGLAGYAQVYGKYNTTPYDKLKLDLTYIENYSLWLDLKLMLLTIKILFQPESTEGVSQKQITALKEQKKEDES